MREPNKQRFMDAVAHRQRPDVALYEMEADIMIVERMLDKRLPRALHSFELPVPDMIEWNRRMGNDMVYFGHVWRLGRKEQADADGRLHYIDGTMKTRASLDRITFPDLDALRRRLDELCNALGGSGFGVVCGTQTAGFTVPTAIGFQDFCLQAALDPDFVQDFQMRIHDYALRELDMYLEYPVDAVKIASGLITSAGPMISPEMLERFDLSYMGELAARAKAAGRHVIFHVDGDVRPWIQRFIELGADVLHPIDCSVPQQSIHEIGAEYGDRIALCGNIDVNGVLLKGTPEDVAADVREHIDRLAEDGGYIVGSSHDLHQELPIANIDAMRDAVHTARFGVERGDSSTCRADEPVKA